MNKEESGSMALASTILFFGAFVVILIVFMLLSLLGVI